ncbi:hypothetical protein L2E82_12644 [Cichorium intybus]|uniref:Uncharacterized protein n=1 Tax=Cichorium intybus TaxID=13427 RepID=A0ACB9GHD8_CICIN|nr:hypothetical protein L2E82_12644 [Cichorium intybus]
MASSDPDASMFAAAASIDTQRRKTLQDYLCALCDAFNHMMSLIGAGSTSANLKQYYATCFSLISRIIIFGGLLEPALKLKLGIGGTSYAVFISSMHLPKQLRE